eukprot:766259-Hanusia_phi.AAC.6
MTRTVSATTEEQKETAILNPNSSVGPRTVSVVTRSCGAVAVEHRVLQLNLPDNPHVLVPTEGEVQLQIPVPVFHLLLQEPILHLPHAQAVLALELRKPAGDLRNLARPAADDGEADGVEDISGQWPDRLAVGRCVLPELLCHADAGLGRRQVDLHVFRSFLEDALQRRAGASQDGG